MPLTACLGSNHLPVGELSPFDLGVADAFLVSGRAIDDNIFLITDGVGYFFAPKDLREPVKNRIASGSILSSCS